MKSLIDSRSGYSLVEQTRLEHFYLFCLIWSPFGPFRNIADAVADKKLGPVFVLAINRAKVVVVVAVVAVRCGALHNAQPARMHFQFRISYSMSQLCHKIIARHLILHLIISLVIVMANAVGIVVPDPFGWLISI